MRSRDIAESLLRGTSILYLFFSRAKGAPVKSWIFSFTLFFLSRLFLPLSIYARTNKASGDKWRGRGINAARHKASPEHPSRSRRWRHWQWKVELWLKIEGLRKNSFKSTGGGDVRGRWRREVRPARGRTSREGGPGGTYRREILPPRHPTAIWHFRRAWKNPREVARHHLARSLARSLTIAFCLFLQSVQLLPRLFCERICVIRDVVISMPFYTHMWIY